MQVGHACLEAGRQFEQPSRVSNLVVLAVPSVSALHQAASRIEMWDIRYVLFNEPDRGLRETALCTEPIYGTDRRCFRQFRLWTIAEIDLARGPPPRVGQSAPAKGRSNENVLPRPTSLSILRRDW